MIEIHIRCYCMYPNKIVSYDMYGLHVVAPEKGLCFRHKD